MNGRSLFGKGMLLAGLASTVLVLGAINNLPAQTPQATTAQAATPAKPVPWLGQASLPGHVSIQERMYYQGFWGIDSPKVKYTESGEMIRFSYRVVDAA